MRPSFQCGKGGPEILVVFLLRDYVNVEKPDCFLPETAPPLSMGLFLVLQISQLTSTEVNCNTWQNPWAGLAPFLEESHHVLLPSCLDCLGKYCTQVICESYNYNPFTPRQSPGLRLSVKGSPQQITLVGWPSNPTWVSSRVEPGQASGCSIYTESRPGQ